MFEDNSVITERAVNEGSKVSITAPPTASEGPKVSIFVELASFNGWIDRVELDKDIGRWFIHVFNHEGSEARIRIDRAALDKLVYGQNIQITMTRNMC